MHPTPRRHLREPRRGDHGARGATRAAAHGLPAECAHPRAPGARHLSARTRRDCPVRAHGHAAAHAPAPVAAPLHPYCAHVERAHPRFSNLLRRDLPHGRAPAHRGRGARAVAGATAVNALRAHRRPGVRKGPARGYGACKARPARAPHDDHDVDGLGHGRKGGCRHGAVAHAGSLLGDHGVRPAALGARAPAEPPHRLAKGERPRIRAGEGLRPSRRLRPWRGRRSPHHVEARAQPLVVAGGAISHRGSASTQRLLG
mmetsp:Transcript_20411/g.62058  ORF Transcript_20411/g.62058 Transcript_20411/m.62058 type:complete len:258 (+) Transcript_20411:4190-4963(+)